MNFNIVFWHIVSTFIGCIVCLLWLTLIQATSIFISMSIAKILVEGFIFVKK